jgi:hypothetical protein
MPIFEFPENASRNDKRDCVEFSVILGPYEGTAGYRVASSGGSSISVRRRSGASRRSISSARGSR